MLNLSVTLENSARNFRDKTAFLFADTRLTYSQINAAANQVVDGNDYNFVSWSNTGARNQTITTPSIDTTYNATLQLVISTWPVDPPPGPTPGELQRRSRRRPR